MLTNKDLGFITGYKKSWIKKKINDLTMIYPTLIDKGSLGRGCTDKVSPILVPYFKKNLKYKIVFDENLFKKIEWKYFVTYRAQSKINNIDYLINFLPKQKYCFNFYSIHNQMDNLHIHFVTTSTLPRSSSNILLNTSILDFNRGLGTFQYLSSLNLKRSNNQILTRFGYTTNFFGEMEICDF